MDVLKSHKFALNRFLKTPEAKGYFMPQSPIKRYFNNKQKSSARLKRIKVDHTPYPIEYFNNFKRESPSSFITKLTPLTRRKSERTMQKSDFSFVPSHNRKKKSTDEVSTPIYTRKKSLEKEINAKSTQVIFSSKKMIYLPTIKILNDKDYN